jgi:DNA-binding IclR family transcriptional regulator
MATKPQKAALAEGLDQDEKYRAPALDKGLDILEILANQSGGMTRTEIVREMGLSPSQIFRMLERLVARGYVARSEGGDRYSLSMKMFLLANRYPPYRRLVASAQPLMDEFARQTDQSCHLVIPEFGTGLIVAQASPTSHWEFRARVGSQLELFTTGSGITLIAFQAPERLDETLNQWGVASPKPLQGAMGDEIDAVRRQGYRIGASGQLVGVTDISAPILGPDGDATAVVTCAFIEHVDDKRAQKLDEALSRLLTLTEALSLH